MVTHVRPEFYQMHSSYWSEIAFDQVGVTGVRLGSLVGGLHGETGRLLVLVRCVVSLSIDTV